MAQQITEHDSLMLHACRAESKFRTGVAKNHLHIDQHDDFCKTSFSLVRAKHVESLSEVPVVWNLNATLLRSGIGATAILLDEPKSIPRFAVLKFGDAEIDFVSQEDMKAFFRHRSGALLTCPWDFASFFHGSDCS